MFDETKELPLDNNAVMNFSPSMDLATEPEGLPKPKSPESGGGGDDVGFARALTDWIMKHRAEWRESRQPANEPSRISVS